MASTGDLIDAVKNNSTYTRQEREKWVEKIIKGDKYAIEKAKRLYERREKAKQAYEKEAKEIVKKHKSRRRSSSIKYVGGRFVDDKGNVYIYDKDKGQFIPTNTSYRDIQASMVLSKGSTGFSEQRSVLKNEAEYTEYLADIALKNIDKSEEFLKMQLEKLKRSKYKSFIVNGKVVSKDEAIDMLKQELSEVRQARSQIKKIRKENEDIFMTNMETIDANESEFEKYIADYRTYLASQKLSVPISLRKSQYSYEDAYDEASSIYESSFGARIASHIGAAYSDLNMFSSNAFEYEGSVLAKYAKWAPPNIPVTLITKALFPEAYNKQQEFERTYFKNPSDVAKERLAEMIYLERTQGDEALNLYKAKTILGTAATVTIPITLGYGSAALGTRFVGNSLTHTAIRTSIPGVSKGIGAVYVANVAYEGYEGLNKKDFTKFVGDIASIPLFVGLGKVGVNAYKDAFTRYVSALKTPKSPVKGKVIVDTNIATYKTNVRDGGIKLIGSQKEILLNQPEIIGQYVLKYELPKKIRIVANDQGYSLKVEKTIKSNKLYAKTINNDRIVTEVVNNNEYRLYVRDVNSGKLLYSMRSQGFVSPITVSQRKPLYARYEVFERLPTKVVKEYEIINGQITLKSTEISQINKVLKSDSSTPTELVVKEYYDPVKGTLVKASRIESIKGYYKEDFAKLINKEMNIVISPKEFDLKPPKGKLRGSLGKPTLKLNQEVLKVSYKDILPDLSVSFNVDAYKLISPFGRLTSRYNLFGIGTLRNRYTNLKNKDIFNLETIQIPRDKPMQSTLSSLKEMLKVSTVEFTQLDIETNDLEKPRYKDTSFSDVYPKLPNERFIFNFSFRIPKDFNFGGGMYVSKRNHKKRKVGSKYTPSLLAVEFGIKGSMPKIITGVGIRPIIKRKRKRKKK